MSCVCEHYSWIQPPVTVEADYSPEKNDILFPIAMFHLPFYSPNGPQYVLTILISHYINKN